MADHPQGTDRDLLDALKGYYDAFINIDDTKTFFYGLADYLEFIDRVPMFEEFSKELFARRKPYEERLEALQKPAALKLEVIKKELADYITKYKIENANILQSLKEYDGWRTKKIVGSNGPLDGMHDTLRDIVEFLYKLPEHKEFAMRYIQFWENNPELIKHYLPVKELNEYVDAEQDYKNGMKNELWGQMGSISWQYQVIRHGEERRKKLVADYERTKSTETSWELMNHNILNGEWQHIMEGRKTDHIYFFKVSEVRQTIVRFQNQLAAEVLLRQYITKPKDGVLATAGFDDVVAEPLLKPRLISKRVRGRTVGYLRLHDKDRPKEIAGTDTRQFLLIQCLFSSKNDIKADFAPTFQNYERVYEAVRLPKDGKNTRLTDTATKNIEMRAIIEYAIKEIQKKKKVRDYLKFEMEKGRMRLQITLPEGREEQS